MAKTKTETAEGLKFFDCEVGVGGTGFDYPSPRTPAELLAMMDRYGIEQALVYDRHAHEVGVFDKFDFILDFCKDVPVARLPGGPPGRDVPVARLPGAPPGRDVPVARLSDGPPGRLYPTIPILPPATGEQPPPDELVAFCLENGVKAVRACPTAHNYIFDSFSMGKLLEPLQKHRIPVIHTSMQVQDHPWLHAPAWQNIRDVAAAFPELPIIVLYTGMLQGRNLFPLLDQCPNVLADLTCESFHFVEDVVERFGSGKLVFASHFPTEDPALYAPMVSYAGIPLKARQAVARDNIRRILEDIR